MRWEYSEDGTDATLVNDDGSLVELKIDEKFGVLLKEKNAPVTREEFTKFKETLANIDRLPSPTFTPNNPDPVVSRKEFIRLKGEVDSLKRELRRLKQVQSIRKR